MANQAQSTAPRMVPVQQPVDQGNKPGPLAKKMLAGSGVKISMTMDAVQINVKGTFSRFQNIECKCKLPSGEEFNLNVTNHPRAGGGMFIKATPEMQGALSKMFVESTSVDDGPELKWF
jgi:hypothetical protein